MKSRTFIALFAATLVIGGCTWGSTPENGDSTASSSASSVRETQNVAYRGILEPAGISIYQEGTHRLTLENGTFVLLESSTVDLNGFVDEEVQVFGSLRPTVEAGGKIMRVTRVELTGSSSSSSSSSTSESSSSDESSSAVSSSRTSASVSRGSSLAQQSTAASQAASVNTSAVKGRADVMASVNMDPANWTQRYCTGHIGFCIPVHKSWWYTSFGTTTTYLWHVEINSEEIKNLGDGPIYINLLSGSAPVSDGTVRAEGDQSVGYRAWTDNRYFMISGDSSLATAVRYITDNLESYEEEE